MDLAETAYEMALDYIYSFVDYSLTKNLYFSPEKFDLGRMAALMGRLGNPDRDFKIFHVAGTKGKGSTAAMIANCLVAAGYRVGFYTSPHLQDYCERIQVNNLPLSHPDFVAMLEEIKPHVDAIEKLTTFEITTALAFWYFSRQKVDVGVIEVGLGGRLDATNVVTPLVSVITSLSIDHINILGDTLVKIAVEKAGIIKEKRPVVLAPQQEEAFQVVAKIAAQKQAKMIRVGIDYLVQAESHTLKSQVFQVWCATAQDEGQGGSLSHPTQLRIPLLGAHQLENAATAYAALQVGMEEGLVLSEAAIQKGFSEVSWPGRFEFLQISPPVVIDSAHNRDSARRLRQALDDYLPEKPVILIFGASEDKDVAGMFEELLPRVRAVVATQTIHPRALEPNKLVELAHQFGTPAVAVIPVEEALDKARELAEQDAAIVAAGSIFLAAAVREVWQRRNH
jgi:dihydrofolate synthase/folylpolyglutamate synthase